MAGPKQERRAGCTCGSPFGCHGERMVVTRIALRPGEFSPPHLRCAEWRRTYRGQWKYAPSNAGVTGLAPTQEDTK